MKYLLIVASTMGLLALSACSKSQAPEDEDKGAASVQVSGDKVVASDGKGNAVQVDNGKVKAKANGTAVEVDNGKVKVKVGDSNKPAAAKAEAKKDEEKKADEKKKAEKGSVTGSIKAPGVQVGKDGIKAPGVVVNKKGIKAPGVDIKLGN